MRGSWYNFRLPTRTRDDNLESSQISYSILIIYANKNITVKGKLVEKKIYIIVTLCTSTVHYTSAAKELIY